MDESASLRRKSINKRRANILLSESEDDQNRSPSTPPQKKARYTESQLESEEEVSIDVDGNDVHSERLSSLSRSVTPPPQRPSTNKRGNKTSSKRLQEQRKRQTVDDSDEDFDIDVVSDDFGTGFPDEYDDDQDFVHDGLKKGKSKSVAKGKGGKGGKGKNPKTKVKAESQEKEITVRDERQGVASSSMKIRIKPSVNVDTAPSTNPGLDSAAPEPDKGDGPSSQSQKKRKLPPIKKNKTVTSGASTTAAKPNASSKSTTTDGVPATPITSATRASTGLQGGDFNLQDRTVYEMLFKSAGGSNARAGNIRENEERRKQLNSMREADKARRALDAKRTFDLQAQMDKISAFEDRLRRTNRCVLYPNILGAKMREVFEQNRRRPEPQEDGEMTWFVDRQSPRYLLLIVLFRIYLHRVYSMCMESVSSNHVQTQLSVTNFAVRS